MKMKTKPTIEEMTAAWRQCSDRIDELSERHRPQVQLPHTMPLHGRLRCAAMVAMVAACTAVAAACTPPPPDSGRALHLSSHSHAVATVKQMMEAAV